MKNFSKSVINACVEVNKNKYHGYWRKNLFSKASFLERSRRHMFYSDFHKDFALHRIVLFDFLIHCSIISSPKLFFQRSILQDFQAISYRVSRGSIRLTQTSIKQKVASHTDTHLKGSVLRKKNYFWEDLANKSVQDYEKASKLWN